MSLYNSSRLHSLESRSLYFPTELTWDSIRNTPGKNYFKFLKNFLNLEGGGSFINQRSMHEYFRSVAAWSSVKILQTVLDPSRISVMEEGVQYPSFTSKIRKFIHDLHNTQEFRERTAALPLNQFSTKLKDGSITFLVADLLRLVIDPRYTSDIQARAADTLLLLEEIAPELSSLNGLVACFLYSKTKRKQAQAKTLLHQFAASPPQSLMQHIPIRPHAPLKGAPSYSTLLYGDRQTQPSSGSFQDNWKIDRIFVGSQAGCYVDNLKEIAAIEGIREVSEKSAVKWLRDPMMILDHGGILVPCRLPIIHREDSAWTLRFDKKNMKSAECLRQLTADRYVMPLGAVEQDQGSQKVFQAGFGTEVKEAPFYFEGGNLLPAINCEGQKVYLCGANNLLFSLFNSDVIFSTQTARWALLQQMMLLENTEEFAADKVARVQERLERAGLLSDFDEGEQEFIAKLTIASLCHIKKLMEASLGRPIIVLGEVFESPIEFHLDMFMLPFLNHTVFVQDHRLCQQLLMHIASHYPLKSDERDRLAMYLKSAEERQLIDGKRLQEMTQKLEKSGFRVIPIPGNFYTETRKLAVNFINSIVGIGTDAPFCISNGSSHPIDRYLRDAFTSILHAHGIDHVYFTGRETHRGLPTFQAADQGIKEMGGVHCRTQEIHLGVQGFAHGSNPATSASSYRYFSEENFSNFYREMLGLRHLFS